MAESAVKSAANWLTKVLAEEAKYLWGAEGKVSELRNELLWMQRFLKKAESLENKDEIVDQWVLQIKEYVAEAEDLVDKFIIEVVSPRRQTGCWNKTKRWIQILKELWKLHQVASGIDSLTLKVSKLTPRLTTYGVNPADGLKTYRTQEALLDLEGQRMTYAHLENKNIVGLVEDTKQIVNLLLDPGEKRRVVAIYGMGGLGKTTLATKVYNDDGIKKNFTRAWVYISKQFQPQNVLPTLLANLTSRSSDMFRGKQPDTLIMELRDVLDKTKCLVVLDDVWETNVLNYLEALLPRDGEGSGSKVFLTTRKEDVAKQADPMALPKPERLTDGESWELLKHTLNWADNKVDKKEENKLKNTAEGSGGKSGIEASEKEDAGGVMLVPKMLGDEGPKVEKLGRSGEKNGIEGSEKQANKKDQKEDAGGFRLGPKMFGKDGRKVEKLGMEMVKNCNGIPLAIVVLGGILRKKETLEGWRLVSENISSYLRRGNDHGKSYMEVLVLSYIDLPYHLKPCFLQLGNFPEDYEIHAEKLYRMWVAEGLVTWPYDRLSSTESLEDIANEYLSLLAQAGMVQIVSKASNGRIRLIRIHDLMRDVCLQKAATENFFTMIDHRSCPDEPQSLSSSLNHSRLLHMAIYLDKDVKNYLPGFLKAKAHQYLRSLLLLNGQEVGEGEVSQWMERICSDFPWLRILDIEGLRLKGRLTKDVQKMKHLRYLSFKGTDVSELPSSIGNLMFLQTLDMRVSYSGSPARIPNTLWKLERLRHLFLPKKPYEIKKSKFLFLHTLKCLEILKNLDVGVLRAQDLQTLRKLKKLSIKDSPAGLESIKSIVDSPAAKSGHLRSCSLCIKGDVIDDDPRIFSSFDCLHLLKIMDKITCFTKNVLPQSLVKLHLESCELRNEHLAILGELRHLKHLFLGYKSVVEKTMICKSKSFLQLINLNLQGLTTLEKWIIERDSMSELKKLTTMDCGNLQMIPDALPESVHVTCSPCISGIEKRGTCNYYGTTFSVVHHQEDPIPREEDTRRLVKLLMDDQSKKVVLVGLAGIDKTALVKTLHSHADIKRKFGAIALVCCPHRRIPSSHRHFINGIIRQLDPAASGDSAENINSTINEIMARQKCLVILTDVVVSSEDIDAIFGSPIPEGSKILLTTDKLPTKEHNKVVHHNLEPLSMDDSFKLLSNILGSSLSGTEGDQKADLGRLMLQHCSGQPQSIMMLAGLLVMKKSLTEWESFHFKVIKEAQGHQSHLYALYYDDLAPHIKDCFLYLVNFPENTEIQARKLYQMWIAAGLVILKEDGKSAKKSIGGSEVEKLLENVAMSYLNELVVRGMVQVGKRGPDKRICTCRLHIVLRSLCLEKAETKGFMRVKSLASTSNRRRPSRRIHKFMCLGSQEEVNVPTIDHPTSSSRTSNEMEHLAVYSSQSDVQILDDPSSINGQLKSLLFFPEASDNSIGDYSWQCFIEICDHFRFLQVLNLEGMEIIKGALPNELGKLSQLKYLSFNGTRVSALPSTIQMLSQLQTLDLRVIPSLMILGDSFRFHHLKQLYLPDSFSVSPSSKLQLGGSVSLQTVENIDTGKVDLDCVSELKNLRRVSINHFHTENELDNRLKFRGTTIELIIKGGILNSNPYILSVFQNLSNMTLKGRISGSVLNHKVFPECLKELKLKHTAIVDDPIPVLRQLPEMTHLFFDHDSFIGKKLTFSVGFPRLAHLTLRLLSKLEELDLSEADHLKHIEPVIIDCWRLEVKLSTGDEMELGELGHHPLLQKLDLDQPEPTSTFSEFLNEQLPEEADPGPSYQDYLPNSQE